MTPPVTESAPQVKLLPGRQLLTEVAEKQYEVRVRHAVVLSTQRAGVKVTLHACVAASQLIVPHKNIPLQAGPEPPPVPGAPPPVPPPVPAPPPPPVPPPVAVPPPPPGPLLQLEISLLPSMVHSKAEPSLKQSFSPQVFEVLLVPLIDTVQSHEAPGPQAENSTNRLNITSAIQGSAGEKEREDKAGVGAVASRGMRRRQARSSGRAKKIQI